MGINRVMAFLVARASNVSAVPKADSVTRALDMSLISAQCSAIASGER
jgi:hypothetical protein